MSLTIFESPSPGDLTACFGLTARLLRVNVPSESSSSSSASFSRTSAGRVIATAGVGSNIIVSNPVEVLSAMVVQHGARIRSTESQVRRTTRPET